MKIKNYHIYLLVSVIAIFTLFSGCGYNNLFHSKDLFSIVSGVSKSPKDVFLKAWLEVKNEYLDNTYNHQDWSRWKIRYLDKIKTKEDSYVAIDSMVESLNDPYTRFLPPSDFADQDRSIENNLCGIGVHIAEKKDGNIIIINTLPGTTSQKSHLKAGDIILKVNGTDVKGVDLRKVADLVRGKAGSRVKLTILRGKRTLVKSVLRQKIDLKSVEYKITPENYAYIILSSFISENTSGEMSEALIKTKNAKGLILDLRGNYGGLLPNAIFIANMFIDQGTIVSIVDKNGNKEIIKAEPFSIFSKKPVVVLINGSSASASEILSGALKDHKRAKLVGEKTFGKGLVQKIVQLPDGSGINITIAKYLTPNGTDINKKGIEPDYKVVYTKEDFIHHRDPQLNKAKQVLAQELAKQTK